MCMHVVYVIQHSETKQIYVGKTKDLKKRLHAHNHGQQTATKRLRGQWILIYAEAYRAKADADTREQKLKQHGTVIHRLKMRMTSSLL